MTLGAVLFIGEFQLRNLIRNQVQLLYFDLRAANLRVRERPNHFLFQGSLPTNLETIVQIATAKALAKEHPIVLICESGERSMEAARALETAGFTNIFVLRGGTETLDLSKD